MQLRQARGGDREAIRRVHLNAFPTSAEADLVDRLESGGASVVSILAEDPLAVGHVLLSRMEVQADGRPLDALALAPVAVVPERQGQGIGSALVQAAVDRARERGIQILFVLGEPAFYRRFGFDVAAAAPFASRYAGPYFQALALGDLAPVQTGTAVHAAAFEQLG